MNGDFCDGFLQHLTNTECGISQLTAAHFVGGHILGN
jgi:hypothetical protein